MFHPWQCTCTLTQSIIHTFSTYLNASSINPPLHPSLPSALEQSTNCCSDKVVISLPVTELAIAYRDSNEPVVENAQHDPHCPWFLTGVTYDLPSTSVQSTAAGLSPTVFGTESNL